MRRTHHMTRNEVSVLASIFGHNCSSLCFFRRLHWNECFLARRKRAQGHQFLDLLEPQCPRGTVLFT